MKNTLAISCRKCGYEKDFYLGVGLLHSGVPDFDSEYAVLPRLVRDPEALARIKRMDRKPCRNIFVNAVKRLKRLIPTPLT